MTDLRAQLQATLGDAYTLERELGGGGMSRVFVAEERALGRIDAATGARKTVKLPDPPAPVTRDLVESARAREVGAARDQAARNVVLSANGSPIARLAVTAGFRVTDVGRDYVAGIHRDDDGVETVRASAPTR